MDQQSADDRFAAQLRRWRELRGLSQTELARQMARLGYSYHQQTVARIENKSRAVPVGEASKLAEILRVKLEVMLYPILDVDVEALEAAFQDASQRAGAAAAEYEAARAKLHDAEADRDRAVMHHSAAERAVERLRNQASDARTAMREMYFRLAQAKGENGEH